MELNNEKVEIQYKYFMDKMENQHKKEVIEMENHHKLLNDKLEKLEKVVSQQKSWWWYLFYLYKTQHIKKYKKNTIKYLSLSYFAFNAIAYFLRSIRININKISNPFMFAFIFNLIFKKCFQCF